MNGFFIKYLVVVLGRKKNLLLQEREDGNHMNEVRVFVQIQQV